MCSEVLAPEHEALKCCSNFRKQVSGKEYAHGYFLDETWRLMSGALFSSCTNCKAEMGQKTRSLLEL